MGDNLEIIQYEIEKKTLRLYLAFIEKEQKRRVPRISVIFREGQNERRMPVPLLFSRKEGEGKREWIGGYGYRLDYLFKEKKIPKELLMTVECRYGDKLARLEKIIMIPVEEQEKEKNSSHLLTRFNLKLRIAVIRIAYGVFRHFPIEKNRIAFLSNRRTDLSGNFDMVYQAFNQEEKWKFWFWLDNRELGQTGIINTVRLAYYCACAKVILVDDYVGLLYQIPRRKGTKMIQLWHACGAFKIFGYSRLGKRGQLRQESMAHRIYDYAIVSSTEIKKYYAEGFGLSENQIIATGIPRTDCFWDLNWQEEKRREFFSRYPSWQGKKILLFAPTFRGRGKNGGFYPDEGCNPKLLLEQLNNCGEEWRVLVKYHPFIHNKPVIEESEKMIDLSDEPEVNDLLPVVDVVLTDYSSLIFEAAILEVPMLFYPFDLEDYEKERGFYYDYEEFVPGKIVYSFQELVQAVKDRQFEAEKIEKFKRRFFDHWDGKSTERVLEFIHKVLET